jgi:hypothetical protein
MRRRKALLLSNLCVDLGTLSQMDTCVGLVLLDQGQTPGVSRN